MIGRVIQYIFLSSTSSCPFTALSEFISTKLIKSGTISNMVGKHEQSYLSDVDQYLVWNNLLGPLVFIIG